MRRATVIAIATAALIAGCGDEGSEEPETISVAAPTTIEAGDEEAAPVAPDDSAGKPEAADDPGADRPRSVEDVVVAVLTGTETPEVICDQLVTPNYVTTAYGDRAGCIAAQRAGVLANSVGGTYSNSSAGETTTVTVVPSGGPYDGVEVTVELVASPDLEGAWLVDSLTADVPAGP